MIKFQVFSIMTEQKRKSCNISDPYYGQILRGEKTHEVRRYTGTWPTVEPGTILTVHNMEQKYQIKVTSVNVFKGTNPLRSLFETIGFKHVIPDASDIEEAMWMYFDPKGSIKWDKNDVISSGVMAIGVNPIL